jgi:hypothetical protein
LSDAHRGAYDFQAFYCAGASLRLHADPYRTEPLEACEHRQTDGTYAALPPGVVVPAPVPPYDLAVFAMFSLVPFAPAKSLWGALLAIATLCALAGTVKVTRAPAGVVFIAFTASLILCSFAFGQLFAIYAAACAGAALFAQRGAWTLAGLAAAATMIEPHLGLPVCACVAITHRKALWSVVGSFAVLAALSLLVSGLPQTLEYVTTVLPLHALSELTSDAQLSLTAVLHAFGAPDTIALRLGTISYVAAAAAGVQLGRILAVRLRDDAFVVFTPAAFVLIGGTYIHATEMFAAIPLTLLLLMRVPRYRVPLCVALVLLSVPWFTALNGGAPAFAGIAAIVVFYEVWQLAGKRAGIAACAAVLAGAVVFYAPAFYAHANQAMQLVPAPPNAVYPQASWRALTQRVLSTGLPITWILRAGSWAGLVTLAFVATALTRPARLLRRRLAVARSTPFVR